MTTITSTTHSTPATPTSKESSSSGSSEIKDQFLAMLSANLQNQDPTEPMDADEMTTQLAQISLVEQQEEANGLLSKIADSVAKEDNTSVLSLVGKTISVMSDSMTYTSGASDKVTGSLTINGSAKSTYSLLVKDSGGNTVGEYDLNSSDNYKFEIDGSELTKGKQYTFSVGTVDSEGKFTESDAAHVSLEGKATSISTWPQTTVSIGGFASVSSDNIVSVSAD